MATTTTNYGLKKPGAADFYNVEDFNCNADIVDTQLKALNDGKANAVTGKVLSTNDYTTAEKDKLASVAEGANNYVHPGSGTNPHGTTKTDVGLGSVDNVKQMPIAGGTFSGQAKAQANTAYTTAQLRNVILSTLDADVTQMQDGDIWIKYA